MKKAGFAPNVVVYTTLLKGHCQDGNVTKARALLREMAEAEPPATPDTRAVDTFLRGCVQTGDMEAAKEVFEEMKSSWDLSPDTTACKCMVRLVFRCSQSVEQLSFGGGSGIFFDFTAPQDRPVREVRLTFSLL